MNKLLELDAKKIKKMIYGKSAEIADKVDMRKGLLSKKVNDHTIITSTCYTHSKTSSFIFHIDTTMWMPTFSILHIQKLFENQPPSRTSQNFKS